MRSRKVTAIAHRGASSYAPENTFAAFDLAAEMGIGDIELDVQFTSDSHIIVIHDETLDKTTNATGTVSELTLEEIQSLDAGSWPDKKFTGERIHTLGEVFERYKDKLRFHIEIKSKEVEGLASGTCDAVREHGVSYPVFYLRRQRGYSIEESLINFTRAVPYNSKLITLRDQNICRLLKPVESLVYRVQE